jgi:superfamily II DNA or RNA helicase
MEPSEWINPLREKLKRRRLEYESHKSEYSGEDREQQMDSMIKQYVMMSKLDEIMKVPPLPPVTPVAPPPAIDWKKVIEYNPPPVQKMSFYEPGVDIRDKKEEMTICALKKRKFIEVCSIADKAEEQVYQFAIDEGKEPDQARSEAKDTIRQWKDMARDTVDTLVLYEPSSNWISETAHMMGLKKQIVLTATQMEGVKFVLRNRKTSKGSIIAHEPGLGKSLLSLVVEMIEQVHDPGVVLILCPKNVVANWISETQNQFGNNIKILLFKGGSKPWESYGGTNGLGGKKCKTDITTKAIADHHIVLTHFQALTTLWKDIVSDPLKNFMARIAEDVSRRADTPDERENVQRGMIQGSFPLLDWTKFTKVASNRVHFDIHLKPEGKSIPMVGAVIGYPYRTVIVDEAHNMRNKDTLLANLCHAFPAPHRLGLTGTPVFNCTEDLWSLFKFIDVPNLMDFNSFSHSAKDLQRVIVSDYNSSTKASINDKDSQINISAADTVKKIKELKAKFDKNPWNVSHTERNAKKLMDIMERWMHRITKNDIAEKTTDIGNLLEQKNRYMNDGWTMVNYEGDGIPPSYQKVIMIDTTPLLLKLHDRINVVSKSQFQSIETSDQQSFLLKIISYQRMLTADVRDVSEDAYRGAISKEDLDLLFQQEPQKMSELIGYYCTEMEPKNEKGIVFVHFIQPAMRIKNRLNEMGIKSELIIGTWSDEEKQRILHKFRKKSDIKFLISTHCISHGINILEANHVIFYTPWWNFKEDEQCWSRVHRKGQTRVTRIVYLTLKGTIDEKIMEKAKSKNDMVISKVSKGVLQEVLGWK